MKYDIAALKRKMLVKYPFFGSVVASVGYKENKDIPTAGTDGETIYYNPEYSILDSLDCYYICAHVLATFLFYVRQNGDFPLHKVPECVHPISSQYSHLQDQLV